MEGKCMLSLDTKHGLLSQVLESSKMLVLDVTGMLYQLFVDVKKIY